MPRLYTHKPTRTLRLRRRLKHSRRFMNTNKELEACKIADQSWKTKEGVIAYEAGWKACKKLKNQEINHFQMGALEDTKIMKQMQEEIDRLREAVELAYVENQNLCCVTTISPKIGWEALYRQTTILRSALSRGSDENRSTTVGPSSSPSHMAALESRNRELSEATMEMVEVLNRLSSQLAAQSAVDVLRRHASLIESLKGK